MKSSLLLPCTCALTAPGGLCRVRLHHLEGRAFPHKQNANCCFGEHLSEKKKEPSPPTVLTAQDVYSPSPLCSAE